MRPTPPPAPSDHDARFLDAYLAGDHRRCPSCSAPLAPPLHRARCPACGEELMVGIGLVEPMTGGIIAGAAGLGAAMGFAGIITVFLFSSIVTRGAPATFVVVTVGAAACTLTAGVLLRLWLSKRGRTRFRTRSAGARRSLIAACWALPPAYMVLLLLGLH